MVDTCTVLAAYSAAHPCSACCLCFSFLVSCRRPLVGNRDHPHVFVADYGPPQIGRSLASPLGGRGTGESADVQILWAGSRSMKQVQVVWTASIPNAVEPRLSVSRLVFNRKLHKKIPRPKRHKIPRHEKVYTQCCNREAPILAFSPVSDAHVGPYQASKLVLYDETANWRSIHPSQSMRLRDPTTRSHK